MTTTMEMSKIIRMLAYAHDRLEEAKLDATPVDVALIATLDDALEEAVDWASAVREEANPTYLAILRPIRRYVIEHRHRADFHEGLVA